MVILPANCFGCGGCAAFCSTGAIAIKTDALGFLVPKIDFARCVECDFCRQICPINGQVEKKFKHDTYACWSRSNRVLNQCSSGGVAYELAQLLLREEYRICGVIYHPTRREALHVIVDNPDEIKDFCGSKYLQSNTVDAFRQLKRPGRYLVFGTPCQISAVRRYARKKQREDDFILVDFFCHGVPSALLWQKYVDYWESRSQRNIQDVTWRSKESGWHDSWNIKISFAENDGKLAGVIHSRKSDGDFFYRMFLGNYCLNPACYFKCRFKGFSSDADIRIGDLWGQKYADNQSGVSGVMAITDRGKAVVSRLHASCELRAESTETVMAGQMSCGATVPWGRWIAMYLLGKRLPINIIVKMVILFNRLMTIQRRMHSFLLRKNSPSGKRK